MFRVCHLALGTKLYRHSKLGIAIALFSSTPIAMAELVAGVSIVDVEEIIVTGIKRAKNLQNTVQNITLLILRSK